VWVGWRPHRGSWISLGLSLSTHRATRRSRVMRISGRKGKVAGCSSLTVVGHFYPTTFRARDSRGQEATNEGGGGAGRGFVEVSNFHCSSRTGRTQPNSGPVVLITIRLRRGHRGPNFRQVCRERRRVLSRLGSTSPCSHTRVKFRSRCTVKPARPNSPASCPRPCLSLLKPPFSPLTILLTYHAVL